MAINVLGDPSERRVLDQLVETRYHIKVWVRRIRKKAFGEDA
jgi:hypothetical protein